MSDDETDDIEFDDIDTWTVTCESHFTGEKAEEFAAENDETDLALSITGGQGGDSSFEFSINTSGEDVLHINFYVSQGEIKLVEKWCKENGFHVISSNLSPFMC